MRNAVGRDVQHQINALCLLLTTCKVIIWKDQTHVCSHTEEGNTHRLLISEKFLQIWLPSGIHVSAHGNKTCTSGWLLSFFRELLFPGSISVSTLLHERQALAWFTVSIKGLISGERCHLPQHISIMFQQSTLNQTWNVCIAKRLSDMTMASFLAFLTALLLLRTTGFRVSLWGVSLWNFAFRLFTVLTFQRDCEKEQDLFWMMHTKPEAHLVCK